MGKVAKQNKTSNQQDIVPFGITVNGSIANSLARMFAAICRLFEAIVDWAVWKLDKKKQE
ncbi:MAG: hypothetical protein WBC05_02885 [Sedimentisphaerales bacterium]